MKINRFLKAESTVCILSRHRGSACFGLLYMQFYMLQLMHATSACKLGGKNKTTKLLCYKFCTSAILSSHFKGSVGVYFSVEVCLFDFLL